MSKTDEADDTARLHGDDLENVLGPQVAALIKKISIRAIAQDKPLFLVGGVVRDLLLGNQNLDLDFVTEGDAIDFAKQLVARFEGSLQVHKRFGTAKWTLDQTAAHNLSLPFAEIPHQIDFAIARSEEYAFSTALPTVSTADIERDLLRRDFTVNTLALQLSPKAQSGRLLDLCDGARDIRDRLIRVLHDRSFVDDPTRILRAMRYSLRLQFVIESHTAELMRVALPMLGRVSGQRLRNEIDLILREPDPAAVLQRLQDIGALEKFHPSLSVSPLLPELFARLRALNPPWRTGTKDRQALHWTMLFIGIPVAEALSIAERLVLRKTMMQSIAASAKLFDGLDILKDAETRPSKIAQRLDDMPDQTLHLGWLLLADVPDAQETFSTYVTIWRDQRPTINGHDLKAMGLTPGPLYKRILEKLRFAWIDGDVQTLEEERDLLNQLLAAFD